MNKIYCSQIQKTSTLEEEENILDAFDKIGVFLPSGCRSGSCGVCVVEIIQGYDQLTPSNTVEKNTLSRLYPEAAREHRTLRLACRAKRSKNHNADIEIKTGLVDL